MDRSNREGAGLFARRLHHDELCAIMGTLAGGARDASREYGLQSPGLKLDQFVAPAFAAEMVAVMRGVGRGGDGLGGAPEIHVRRVVHAGHGAARSAAFFRDELAADIVLRILRQWFGGIAALLRAVVDEAVFANVEVAGAGAALPLVLDPLGDVVLELIHFCSSWVRGWSWPLES
jgi:hypothetical protein